MKKKNSYRRKGGGVRPEHKQHVMFARRSVKNKRGGSQSGLFPSVWQTWDPGRRNHSSDVSRVGVSADSNNKTHIVAHTSLLTLSLSFSVELQDRDWKRRHTYTPRGERQRWLNRHTVLGFTGSSDAFPVLRGKKKKRAQKEERKSAGRRIVSLVRVCVMKRIIVHISGAPLVFPFVFSYCSLSFIF